MSSPKVNKKRIKANNLRQKKNALLFEYFKKLDLIDKNKHSFEIIPDHKKFDLSNINIIKKI